MAQTWKDVIRNIFLECKIKTKRNCYMKYFDSSVKPKQKQYELNVQIYAFKKEIYENIYQIKSI